MQGMKEVRFEKQTISITSSVVLEAYVGEKLIGCISKDGLFADQIGKKYWVTYLLDRSGKGKPASTKKEAKELLITTHQEFINQFLKP